jgi:cell division topological specificity factor
MSFIDRVFRPGRTTSRQMAKERLQLVLVHDRAQISPQMMQTLKDELIAVISRYVSIEQDGVEITLANNRRESRLQADIPLIPRQRTRSASGKRMNG